ncbi:sulfite exporter TauE/SafE family protein [Caldalkalibacillus salinus]|uniref:sulfite exporter TauE/SafE family protein n=1 Tax=Caldalkalibacillus salinus TaxID=2803787 RepID=UPI001F1AA258|nr:sulfite exporter TauE/SafE family protein [Caldalkalibacillus salinus]
MYLFWIVVFLLGLFASTVGSLVGLGGGVFVVPGLLFMSHTFPPLAHVTPQIAVGTSLLVVSFTALGSTLSYAKKKTVDFKSGFFFFLASGPGSIAGAYLNQGLDEKLFHLVFGFMMIIILFLLIKNKRVTPKDIRWHMTRTYTDDQGQTVEYGYHYVLALSICFLIGLVQGLLGIGGGSLLVPAMILLFWFPTHMAIATTMFVILLSSITGSMSHIYMQNIDWFLLMILAPGALIGGQLGALIASKVSSEKLSYLLKGMILILAILSISEGIR